MYMIHGEKVALRPIVPEDYPLLVKWSRDEELNKLMDGDYPATVDECALWHKQIKSNRHRQMFGIQRLGGGLIGDIELDHIAWRSGDAELRVRIGDKSLWGQGLGTEAVTLMLSYAFASLKLKRVYLRVFSSNKRAIASYRKAGFKSEGSLTRRTPQGERKEIVLMRILRDEFQSVNVGTAQGIAVDM